jgi:hypothetical protein
MTAATVPSLPGSGRAAVVHSEALFDAARERLEDVAAARASA